jgi:hypothetical protein
MPIDAVTVDPVYRPPLTAYRSRFETATTDTLVWLRELDRLLTLENYNGFTLQASQWAYDCARSLLDAASEQMIIPLPEFTPDGDGGIDIEWEYSGRRLALSCSANPNSPNFISWREPQGRYEGDEASGELLNNRLEWLMG